MTGPLNAHGERALLELFSAPPRNPRNTDDRTAMILGALFPMTPRRDARALTKEES